MTWRFKRSTRRSAVGIRCVCAKHLPELAELEVRQLPPSAPSLARSVGTCTRWDRALMSQLVAHLSSLSDVIFREKEENLFDLLLILDSASEARNAFFFEASVSTTVFGEFA